jgi:hypothetical protein
VTADDEATERTAVRTYVPAYQKEEWRAHADRLDMSQSEFVRTMVQAGRREFSVPTREETPSAGGDGESSSSESLRARVLSILDGGGHHSWDDLVESLTADIEDRLDETLQSLQSEGRIRYSGRRGGYTAVEGDRGD